MTQFANDKEAVDAFAAKNERLRTEIGRVIVGQRAAVDRVLTSIFCNSHSLLVGVPGLAKTLLVHTISEALDLSFNRIQFTPDLMPSDIIGHDDRARGGRGRRSAVPLQQGPVFNQIVLADEINRTPPKTQAALLEAMQERAVTVQGQRTTRAAPFFVMATQNPIEQEGTYPAAGGAARPLHVPDPARLPRLR